MFELDNFGKYLTFLSYIGFIISAISGFVEVSQNIDVCELLVSILVFFNIICIFYLDIMEMLNEFISLKINYSRSYILLTTSFLVLGLSPLGLAFGIIGIFVGILNIFIGIFYNNNNKVDNEANNI